MDRSNEDGGRRDGRGQLRIYLGSAAGVGKTFAMLGEGHRRQERGTEVVVAFVETHGREHTAALLDGMEIMPRAKLAYRGRGPAAGSPARAGWPATPWRSSSRRRWSAASSRGARGHRRLAAAELLLHPSAAQMDHRGGQTTCWPWGYSSQSGWWSARWSTTPPGATSRRPGQPPNRNCSSPRPTASCAVSRRWPPYSTGYGRHSGWSR